MKIKHIKPWKILIGIFIVTIIPTVFVILLERYTTSNENFCMTCHYKMWGKNFLVHSNIHPDSVRCPQCHAKHNQLIPKDFSAHPDRINPNCVRCHQEMSRKSDTEGFRFNVMKIQFSHRLHIQEVGVVCTDCHYNIKHDKFRPVTNRPRMESCFSCHDRETTSCDTCHRRGVPELLSSLPRTTHIERRTCEKCHPGFEEKPISFYKMEFSHEKHRVRESTCPTCHNNATLHGRIIKSREACMKCHHQESGKECSHCHLFERRFRNGTLLKDFPGKPEPMAEVVACGTCHSGIAEGHSKKAVLSTCVLCHEEKGIEKKVEQIQKRTTEGVKRLTSLLQQSRKVVETLPEVSQREAEPVLRQGEKILEILRKDRSHGFHNPAYSSLLLKNTGESLQQLVSRHPAEHAKKQK